jgi:hypothetical protein
VRFTFEVHSGGGVEDGVAHVGADVENTHLQHAQLRHLPKQLRHLILTASIHLERSGLSPRRLDLCSRTPQMPVMLTVLWWSGGRASTLT